MPIEKFFEFITYLAPGFLAIEIYRAIYPAKERNQFAQIAWSVIYGIAVFGIVRWLDIALFNCHLQSTTNRFPNFHFILPLFIIGISVGFLRALFHYVCFILSQKVKYLKFLAPDPQSIWAKINQKHDDWALVYLDDGSIYLGYISNYTFNPNIEHQDFLLSKAKRVNEDITEKYLVTGIGVYLNTRDVKRIEFLASSESK